MHKQFLQGEVNTTDILFRKKKKWILYRTTEMKLTCWFLSSINLMKWYFSARRGILLQGVLQPQSSLYSTGTVHFFLELLLETFCIRGWYLVILPLTAKIQKPNIVETAVNYILLYFCAKFKLHYKFRHLFGYFLRG